MQEYQVEEIKPHQVDIKSGSKAGQKSTMYFLKLSGESASTFDDMSQVKIGETIKGTITLSDKKDKDGNPYKNFKLPREADEAKGKIERLELVTKALIKKVGLTIGELQEAGMPEPTLEGSPETSEPPNKAEVDKDIKEAFPDAEIVNEEEDINLDDIPF